MLLAQISDTHLVAAGPRRASRALSLERALAFLSSLDPRPAAVIHTGDLAHNAKPEQYALAAQLLAGFALPLVAVPGNRDLRAPFLATVPPPAPRFEGSPFVQFALDLGPVRLIALDTVVEGRGLGGYCAARLDELSRLLAQSDDKPTVVALHHPPVALPSVPGSSHFVVEDEAHRLAVALARDPTVVAVIAGHVHRRATAPLGRASVETMPSLAVDLRKGVYPRGQSERPIVLLHEIEGHRVTTRSVALEPV